MDALRVNGRPDLLALLCTDASAVLADNGAKADGAKLRNLAGQIFVSPDPYGRQLDRVYEQIVPAISRGVQEILEKEMGQPLPEPIDVRQSVLFALPRSDVPVAIPDFAADSQKALYRLINEEMGPYEQHILCLKLDAWNELALALIQGGLEADFPHPQRTAAGKLLEVGTRDQILFCYHEAYYNLEAGAIRMLEKHLDIWRKPK